MAYLFDFPQSQIPDLKALDQSFYVDNFEREIKNLFISLFKEHLGVDAFDGFVLGAPQLGSYGLVQKSINQDGLAVLKSQNQISDENATRYLYRAWKSGDVQKRGLFILQVYLKLIFGNLSRCSQLQQKKGSVYPLVVDEYDPEKGLLEGYFLTSRVIVDIDVSYASESVKTIISSLESVLAARFVVEIRFLALETPRNTIHEADIGGVNAVIFASGKLIGEF